MCVFVEKMLETPLCMSPLRARGYVEGMGVVVLFDRRPFRGASSYSARISFCFMECLRLNLGFRYTLEVSDFIQYEFDI